MPLIEVAVGAKEAEKTLGSALEMNFFLILAVLGFAIVFYFLKLHRGFLHARGVAFLGAASTVFVVVGLGLEHYWVAQCPIHPEKLRLNQVIFRNNIKFLEARPDDVKAQFPYWVSDGTLLDVVRESKTMKLWDHDTDVAMIYDLDADPGAEKLKADMEAFLEQKHCEDCKVVWRPDAQHLQIYSGSLAHGDIWVWQRGKVIDGEAWVTTPSRLFKHVDKRLKESWLAPPKRMTWHVDNNPIEVSVPNNSDEYLTWLFGKSYMTPYRNRIQCAENIWIHAHPSWKICYLLVAAVAAYFMHGYLLTLARSGRLRANSNRA
eukprot:TRINITY_DN8222_c0_g1_i2.p1 TRINITY_DN8222_c0_g1~~TRINITY_DN8222_c0_g1_i2.p1  ORF type:complete len:344 (+),score=137.12 TRINITY_DN8222_c0_g1_i2:76-1032(+)